MQHTEKNVAAQGTFRSSFRTWDNETPTCNHFSDEVSTYYLHPLTLCKRLDSGARVLSLGRRVETEKDNEKNGA